MTIRPSLAAAILLATIAAGVITSSTALLTTPSPKSATGELSTDEIRQAPERYRDTQPAWAGS